MSVPSRNRSPYQYVKHILGQRYVGDYSSPHYDKNVRYALEDIAVHLGRIADALEGKSNDDE